MKLIKKCYFVLYDMNDELICFIDNYNELSVFINKKSMRDIVFRLIHSKEGFITIYIDNVPYKLFVFSD